MLDWLHKKLPPLTGAPAVRRQKTYSAQNGYVYVYYYTGCRKDQRGAEQGTQFVFEVSGDRKAFVPVSVFLPVSAIEAWEAAHHELRANERHAIAKMALFQAFDERANPAQMAREILVRRADAESIMETLEMG